MNKLLIIKEHTHEYVAVLQDGSILASHEDGECPQITTFDCRLGIPYMQDLVAAKGNIWETLSDVQQYIQDCDEPTLTRDRFEEYAAEEYYLDDPNNYCVTYQELEGEHTLEEMILAWLIVNYEDSGVGEPLADVPMHLVDAKCAEPAKIETSNFRTRLTIEHGDSTDLLAQLRSLIDAIENNEIENHERMDGSFKLGNTYMEFEEINGN